MKKFTLLSSFLLALIAVKVSAADTKEQCMDKKNQAIRAEILKACNLQANFEYDKLSKEDKDCLNEETKNHEDDFKNVAKSCGM